MKNVPSCAVRVWPLVVCTLLATRIASADSGNIEDILPLANDPDDPIGLERDPAFDRAAAAKPARSGPAPMSAEERARFGPTPPPFAAKSGEALTAVPSVRESSHRVNLEFIAGLALVEAELRFENTADKPAEVEYRLATPEDAALAGLEVCNARGCRSGVAGSGAGQSTAYDDVILARGSRAAREQLPAAQATVRRDARGTAVLLRAAAVERDDPLTVRVRYVVAAPVHGGIARLQLPARGMDPRVAQLELSLRASDLASVHAGAQPLRLGEATVKADAWQSIEVRASLTAASRSVWQFPCGKGQCARVYVAAPPRTPAPVDLVLAIDASPSMEGVARSRLLPAIAAILARTPEGSRVRALRFASQAEPLVRERKDPAQLGLSAFSPVSFEAELGSATRFEAAWELIRGWRERAGKLRPLIVILGDGGITRGKAKPFEAARRAGFEVSVLNVGGRPTHPALVQGTQLTGGTLIEAGSEADAAMGRGADERLEERVAALFAPVAVAHVGLAGANAPRLPALRAGESLQVEAPSRGGWTLQAGNAVRSSAPPARLALALAARGTAFEARSPVLAVDPRDLVRGARDRPDGAPGKNSCDRRGPAFRHGGLSSDAKPIALAAERVACAQPPMKEARKSHDEEDIGTGMPSSPLLGMLRQRIIPVARGCFRRDRAGRSDYQVRAVFAFELAEREVVSAEVTGKITEALRACLLQAVDALAVPRFSGRVIVRYPLVTDRETLPSQIELTPQVAERVDALIGP